MSGQFVVWNSIHNEHGSGSWAVIDGDMLVVRTCNGTKMAQLGGSPPQSLARLLMYELAGDWSPDVA